MSIFCLLPATSHHKELFSLLLKLTLAFSLLFQELKLIGLDIPHFAADLPMNRCKNRYTNILPCEYSTLNPAEIPREGKETSSKKTGESDDFSKTGKSLFYHPALTQSQARDVFMLALNRCGFLGMFMVARVWRWETQGFLCC